MLRICLLVGVPGLQPGTSPTPWVRAKQLRHTPTTRADYTEKNVVKIGLETLPILGCANIILFMEPSMGFEPTTLGLRYRCSTAELGRRDFSFGGEIFVKFIRKPADYNARS